MKHLSLISISLCDSPETSLPAFVKLLRWHGVTVSVEK